MNWFTWTWLIGALLSSVYGLIQVFGIVAKAKRLGYVSAQRIPFLEKLPTYIGALFWISAPFANIFLFLVLLSIDDKKRTEMVQHMVADGVLVKKNNNDKT